MGERDGGESFAHAAGPRQNQASWDRSPVSGHACESWSFRGELLERWVGNPRDVPLRKGTSGATLLGLKLCLLELRLLPLQAVGATACVLGPHEVGAAQHASSSNWRAI